MINLFIDTSMANVSISILKDNKILSIIQEEIPNEHSKYVTSYVKRVIDEASLDANDIDNILVVNGPGSFTGVRIGVTIAKTYGYLINKEIIPVSSLKALAISSSKSINGNIMSVITANRSSYYVGIYDSEYNNIIDEEFVSRERLVELIEKYNPYIVSNDYNIISNPDDLYSYVRLPQIDEYNTLANLKRATIFSPDGATDYIRPIINKMTDEEFAAADKATLEDAKVLFYKD